MLVDRGWYLLPSNGLSHTPIFVDKLDWFESGKPGVRIVMITGHAPPRLARELWSSAKWKYTSKKMQQQPPNWRPTVNNKGLDVAELVAKLELELSEKGYLLA